MNHLLPLYPEVWLNFVSSLLCMCYLRWKSLEEKLYLNFM